MPATVTLATTTLADGCLTTGALIKVASATGIVPGYAIYVDRELIRVNSIGLTDALGTNLQTTRGVGSTTATPHSPGAPVTIGRMDQFYDTDPVGAPPPEILVTPWINVVTGDRWVMQGDSLPGASGSRWWAKNVNTHDVGALGVRTNTYAPSNVTQA